ncbi:MAG: type II toxin-antitoxin system VapB family antitoxin [bacterium]|nr:type II toxin-antitoxin system VapB family antitoxin [bacterium]
MTRIILTDDADRMARQLAERTGESLTETVTIALRERLDRTSPRSDDWEERLAHIREIQRRVAASPILCEGSDNELLYDADGLPK